jgi:hypothetical protein
MENVQRGFPFPLKATDVCGALHHFVLLSEGLESQRLNEMHFLFCVNYPRFDLIRGKLFLFIPTR